ncbi:nucleoside transporter [Acrodontium crateriforme]|uniref:Nucleoside transporter n=1 Tax=Acrodontium crateriforme TaxID=150365 RepID=A0AAQ3R6G0_9PEZI|nr:nucleoside transporter [Acrodontium crateriforme]
MDRLRKLWQREQDYEPLEASITSESSEIDDVTLVPAVKEFSYVEYTIFLLLGVSMLWAWNMFLAAGPYFSHRFRNNDWIMENFQAAEITVSTVTNLGFMLLLTRLQANASYPKRIVASLCISMACFALLAVSTRLFRDVSAGVYFGFLIVMIFLSTLGTALCQNGIFAYVSGFGQPKYTQGIMTGQAVAGVLPCVAQIVSVLAIHGTSVGKNGSYDDNDTPHGPSPVKPSAAMTYFLTATVIAAVTLIAFLYLQARTQEPKEMANSSTPTDEDEPEERKQVPMIVMARKLRWLAAGVFTTFVVTIAVFPVYTQRIVSVRPPSEQTTWFTAPVFIPLGFLFWNIGDLLGRLTTAVPSLSLTHRPFLVFLLAIARISFLGLYHLCNVRGRGAVVSSDFFYLVVVQVLFGLTNGYLGSICMIGAGEWVEPEEREAAGGFMSLCLVAGLTTGSLASFFAAGA